MKYGRHKLRYLIIKNGEKRLQELVEVTEEVPYHDDIIDFEWRDVPFVVENQIDDVNFGYFEEE